MKALLIYELNPEDLSFYSLDLNETEKDILCKAHNKMYNRETYIPEMGYICYATSMLDKEDFVEKDVESTGLKLDEVGKWSKCKLDISLPITEKFDAIFHTGQYL